MIKLKMEITAYLARLQFKSSSTKLAFESNNRPLYGRPFTPQAALNTLEAIACDQVMFSNRAPVSKK